MTRAPTLPDAEGAGRRRALTALVVAALAPHVPDVGAAEVGKRIAWRDVDLLDGRTLGAEALRGRVVVVEFWASWCPFCKRQNPVLQQLYDAHRGRGLDFLTFSIDNDPAKARAYVAEHAYTFPAAMAGSPLARQFEPRSGLPELYVVGADGRIVFRESGEMFPEDVRALSRFARA